MSWAAVCAQSAEAFNLSPAERKTAYSGPEVKWSAAGLDCVHGHGLWWRWRVFVCLHRVWCPAFHLTLPTTITLHRRLVTRLFVPTGDVTADFPSDETDHVEEPWVFLKATTASSEVEKRMYCVY